MGMDVDVARVAHREPNMNAVEVMTSESQERMLAIVEPAHLDQVLAICERWEISASVIGNVTGTGRFRILDRLDGEVLGDIPASSLDEEAPLYERPLAAPPDLSARLADRADSLPAPASCADDLLAMLADSSWVFSQYDHQLFLNTVEPPGGDAAVLRLKDPITGADTGRGIAMTTDGNHRWCALDPRAGTALVVAEAVMNLATVGARPLGLVNCLNFGNPEHPEVMWQLSEAIDGMGDACRALRLPVVGGNVSLYNESRGSDIDPSPVVGVVGMVDSLERRPPGITLVEGGALVLLGPADDELSGSRWAWDRGHKRGTPPALDLGAHQDVADLVRSLVVDGLLVGVHDCADGNGVALAEMAARSGVGVQVSLGDGHAALFAESPSRVVACVAADRLDAVLAAAQAAGVEVNEAGLAGGDRFVIDGLVDLSVAAVAAAWRGRIPEALGAGTAH
jgi:phosphoribosylformylglycinamidine synthase